jgi:hypothetical protein
MDIRNLEEGKSTSGSFLETSATRWLSSLGIRVAPARRRFQLMRISARHSSAQSRERAEASNPGVSAPRTMSVT